MAITNNNMPDFKPGDILEVDGNQNIELVVAKEPLIYRNHSGKNVGYCYWHGLVYKRKKNSVDTLLFLKLTPSNMSIGVQKLEKEKSFCVDHPYIERVYGLYDVKAKNGNPMRFKALLCEYIDGPSMLDYYKGIGITNRDEEISLFRYFLQLMLAVKFYTEQSYLDTHAHRDLKPDNIIICKKEKKVVIIDFDFAHVPGINTMNIPFVTDFNMPFGTKCTNVQKDIYTLGWTFLFCLTGVVYPWFQKEENDGYFGFPRDHILMNARKYLEEYYSGLINLITKMIADPASADAYTSIDELIRDYKRILEYYVKDKNQRKEVLAGTELLLQASKEEDEGYPVYVRYILEKGGNSIDLWYNFTTHYYSFDDKDGFQNADICFQNIYGDIYYMVLNDKVETNADKTVHKVKTGDTFCCDKHKVTIEVFNPQGIEGTNQETVKEVKWFLTKLKNRYR